jgi:hypothetical protein
VKGFRQAFGELCHPVRRKFTTSHFLEEMTAPCDDFSATRNKL